MAPDALAQVLRPIEQLFPTDRFPDLLVGLGELRDDAAVWRVRADLAVIATVDFFTPIVDDPYTYGAIAATNALSDVYAMGGKPFLALNISCLSECLPPEVIGEILRGGAAKVAEAGAVLAGGHSVNDHEPKYGLVALGFGHPDRLLTKAGARPGDVLVLTKPLGVGLVTTALKAEAADAADIDAAVASMLRLNAKAAEILVAHDVRGATDVTGFSLLGHACEMAERSGVTLHIDAARLPTVPGAPRYADEWLFPGGTAANQRAFGDRVQADPGLAEERLRLAFTPETSGGLLAAVPASQMAAVTQAFAAAGEPLWEIGAATAPEGGAGVKIA